MSTKKKNPDLKDMMILESLGQGVLVKNIASSLSLSHRQITRKIAWLKEKYKCETIAQLTKKSASLKVDMKP